MLLNSDITLNHHLWERADEDLCSNKGLCIFKRLVDVYVLACAIGIKEDKRILESEISVRLETPKSIGRNTHRENLDLRDMLDSMLQNSIINSKTINVDLDERMRLAFNPDYNNPKIGNGAAFLTSFANYGIEEIFKRVNSTSPLIIISELYEYFDELCESQYEDLLKNITLETLLELDDEIQD